MWKRVAFVGVAVVLVIQGMAIAEAVIIEEVPMTFTGGQATVVADGAHTHAQPMATPQAAGGCSGRATANVGCTGRANVGCAGSVIVERRMFVGRKLLRNWRPFQRIRARRTARIQARGCGG